MTHTTTERVLRKVKSVSEVIPRDTGIATSLTELEIKEYVVELINETKKQEAKSTWLKSDMNMNKSCKSLTIRLL